MERKGEGRRGLKEGDEDELCVCVCACLRACA